ncbi:GNAT family N-acetyltransferase [Paenibacillus sp. PL2-23]|uniref:GNAT family N-acetyltransferase n=1 Tax=Paenibacillus sp. PL2-23 TaxID=2100729 RepID=UPI0030FCE040
MEAKLIGASDIPPLRDTVEDIQSSEETFMGCSLSKTLVGFVSYEVADGALNICRMVVHPDYFRRGIAKRLLAYAVDEAGAGMKVTVSTGALNEPAKLLYRSFNFVQSCEREVAPGIRLAYFELSPDRVD